jgi:hypothetical protein
VTVHVFDAETRLYRTDLKRARQRLAALADDAPEEEYQEANHRVTEARERLEWHQCLDIQAGIYDHADEF